MTCYAFGWGKNGQLGIGEAMNCPSPMQIPSLKEREVEGAAAGSRCTVAVTTAGQVYAWGKGDHGQLGLSGTEGVLEPRIVEELAGVRVTQVSCRGSHMAALDSSGQVWTWGEDNEGQLGRGFQPSSTPRGASCSKPAVVKALQHASVASVCCGREFTAAVMADGSLYTWGNGSDGQLGYDGVLVSGVPRPVKGLHEVTSVACGSRHVLALSSSGGLFAWGWNAYGQLGSGDTETASAPLQVELERGLQVKQIACGYRHSAAVASDGSVFTWGWGGHGQLGHGDWKGLRRPQTVQALQRRVRDVACGGSHTLFVVEADALEVGMGRGQLYACGRNDDGQLGHGTVESACLPVLIPLDANVKSCSLGWAHSLVITQGPTTVGRLPSKLPQQRSASESVRRALGESITRGDLDAFFAFFMNCLLQLMVIRHLSAKMLGGSEEATQIVLQRVLPAVGATMLCGHGCFAWQGIHQAMKSGRWDWTSQPHGINSVTLFPFLQLVMYPVVLSTNDPKAAWAAGVFGNFVLAAFQLVVCVPLAHTLRRMIPTSSLFAALAGTGITFLTLNFVFNIFAHPVTSFLPFALVLMSFSAEVRFPGGLPGGFVALLSGMVLGWLSYAYQLQPVEQGAAADPLALVLPSPQIDALLLGASHWGQVLSVVFPLGVLNLVNNLAAIESASVTHDEYSVTESLLLDACADIVGALLGNPFPTAIFIGQPAYKKMGARQGYLMLNAAVVVLITCSCSASLFLLCIPLEAVETMLVWIGVVITAQAFTSTTRVAAGAVAMGMIPGLCAWAANFLQSALAQEESATLESLVAKRPDLCLEGLLAVSSGYLFVSIVLASVYAHVEERRFRSAATWALVGAALSAVGMVHSFRVQGNTVLSDVGLLHSPRSRAFTGTYLLLALLFWVTSKVQDLSEESNAWDWWNELRVKVLARRKGSELALGAGASGIEDALLES